MTEMLDLAAIIANPNLQPRQVMNQHRIVQYAEAILAGIALPPLRVFRVSDRDDRLFLTSGFHRHRAAEQAGLTTIECEVFMGTFAEARWDAAGSNVEFDDVGMPRTNADKRQAARMAWEARPAATHQQIADQARVSHQAVSKWIKEWKNESCNSSISDRLFNLTNDNVDWAKWTWNPVTGCEHTCVYCYARDIANRFYAEKFKPTFHADRLEAPRHTEVPEQAREGDDPIERTAWRNVFVCSMADLFGRWVPDDWIGSVLASCRRSPQWNYLYLTKFPQRYTGLKFPETAWVGTSVDEQKRVANAEKAFRKIEVPVRWLSIEPMLEPIEFSDLRMFDWVVIGGQSRSSGAPEFFPDPFWVNRLIDRAHDAGCKVYCKPNTDPQWHWAGIFKEYPAAFDAAGA
jgi:protein gp37